VEGNTNRQIALKLGISVKTVEKHRFSLMEKLGMRDVTGLVRFAMTHGIIPRDRG
jgi:DNA-binding NarL/FixJ family response regulator